jgi:hypothetical protein
MQYTLRGIPPCLDQALRQQAREEGKSLNQVVIDALLRALGLSGEPTAQRDLSDIAGTWKDDPVAEESFEEQRQIDHELWA